MPEAKNWWKSGSFERKTSKFTSTRSSADDTKVIITAIAGGEKSQPNHGSIFSSIQSGSMPRNRIDMMFASHAIHCFQIRCFRRS